MTKIFQTFSLTILIALSSSFSYAIEEEKNELSLQEEITEYINHHVQDSHDFSLFSTKDKKTGDSRYSRASSCKTSLFRPSRRSDTQCDR